jgi:hypothetical protein
MKNPKLMPIIGLILLVLALISMNSCQVQHYKYPIKTAAYWLSPTMSKANAKNLALYSIVVADEENLINNPHSLKIIKRRNKDVKLLCYTNPMEIFNPMVPDRPIQSTMAKEILEKYPQWLLKISDGENATFWPGMTILNLSTDCPKINGKTYVEYIAEKKLIILKNKVWDGSFEDNNGGNISWVYLGQKFQIDADNDGKNDIPDSLDYKWSIGVQNYLTLIRSGMNDTKLIIGNKGSVEFTDLVDGRWFEWFPNDYLGGKKNFGWDQCMINAEKTGAYTVFHVRPDDFLFGIASSLLVDNVYVAVAQNDAEIHPEFNIQLGKALDKAQYNDTCYFRNYEKGRVEVRPWNREGKINLFKK